MQVFSPKRNQPQRRAPSDSTRAGKAANVARRWPGQAEPVELEARRDAGEANRFAHDFSKIPASAGPPSVRVERTLMRSAGGDSSRRPSGGAGEAVARARDVLRSPGRPLEPSVREEMESRLGHTFSAVRVHDDSEANDSASALGADAYTVGRDVVFGQRMSGFRAGAERELLTHELVHVAQAGGAGTNATSFPTRVSSPTDAAEREADRLSRGPDSGAARLSAPRAQVSPGTLLRQPQRRPSPRRPSPRRPPQQQPAPPTPPRIRTTQADFHDPNFCYRPNTQRDSLHPDRSRVVAVMQAQIATPTSCNGFVSLRTSVLRSFWGAAEAQFESCGGGQAQGGFMRLHRDEDAQRVDYEEQFSLNACAAYFERSHLITFYEGSAKYTFAEAIYRPSVSPTSGPGGAVISDATPAPQLTVEPCDNITPTLCRGAGGAAGTGTPAGADAGPSAQPPSTPTPPVRGDR